MSVSPHVKSKETVGKIMWTVSATLVPLLVSSIFIFGFQTLVITAVSVLSCVAVEVISQKCLHRPVTIKDGSAVLTGLLLAYVIPPGVSIWMPVLGAVMAIYVAKHLLGGIGSNIFNPALIGRAFLMATFPVAMTSAWLSPSAGGFFGHVSTGVDAVSTATPLFVLKHFGMQGVIDKFGSLPAVYNHFLMGLRPGCIGETSAVLIILGGLFLLYMKYISWHIPVSVVVSVAFFTWIFGGDGYFTGNPILAVLSGGVLLGAVFMATDYVTAPSQPIAKLIYGTGIGALTVLIRLKGGYPEGICYAILLMNAITPTLETHFRPRRFAPPKGAAK